MGSSHCTRATPRRRKIAARVALGQFEVVGRYGVGAPQVLRADLANDLARHAHDDGTRRDSSLFGDEGAGRDQAFGPNLTTREQQRAAAEMIPGEVVLIEVSRVLNTMGETVIPATEETP